MEGLLATLLAGQQQPSQPTAPPLQPPAVEPAGSSATSPNLLAFDAGQAYARACHEYASATKAYQLAQQAQQAQEQIAAWWTAAAKNHPPATEKEPATPAVDISQFVKEAVDARITEQWQKDEKQVAHFKSVQEQGKEHSETETAVKKPLPKARPYPMERIGAMEVSAGTLEVYCRLIPKKTPPAETETIDLDAGSDKDAKAPQHSKPVEPSGPPPGYMKNINKPPPAVPVWGGKDNQKLGSICLLDLQAAL